ncbi:hypothetical protein GALMADRAFT_248035 [Galerina marginata CBS 339.88]|uniref:Uncharacterized protein n=1 Tax=Galerina marginata (strain CBS 339.88) TaxID=685588 RepID=A0A067SZS1_GALM3|nr:hypothetical protein GALMADRAFT_248035 [Galerina marginata CBS 339.88]
MFYKTTRINILQASLVLNRLHFLPLFLLAAASVMILVVIVTLSPSDAATLLSQSTSQSVASLAD